MRAWAFFPVLMVAVLAALGCGGSGTDRGDTYTIAVIPKGMGHQFWNTVRAGADAAGGELGADIVWIGPSRETEVARQIEIVTDMITRRVDAIVMAACDETALIGPIQRAINAGIPVVTIDSGVDSDLPVSFVATDNIAGAHAAAEVLAELIGGEGAVGLLPFVRGAATSELREQGFLEGIAEFEDIEVAATLYTQSDVARAMNATQDMMTSNPELRGIFAANEPACLGAMRALQNMGRAGDVKLVAFDASEDQITGLQSGAVHALIVQNPFSMGYRGVEAAIDAIEGRAVPDRIDTGVTVVTMENFNDPDVQELLFPLGQ